MLNDNTRQRPPLNHEISIQDFLDFYWLKSELEEFCQQYGLSPSGGKIDIAKRVEQFLRTGEKCTSISQPKPSSPQKTQNVPVTHGILNLDTVIPVGFVCTQENRVFFESIIGPKFHFTVKMQQFFRENPGKTYRDAVNAWYEYEALKKDKNYKTNIDPQFEYNRFIRAFYEDPKNKGLPIDRAIHAWKITRSRPGPNIYSRDEDCFANEHN